MQQIIYDNFVGVHKLLAYSRVQIQNKRSPTIVNFLEFFQELQKTTTNKQANNTSITKSVQTFEKTLKLEALYCK